MVSQGLWGCCQRSSRPRAVFHWSSTGNLKSRHCTVGVTDPARAPNQNQGPQHPLPPCPPVPFPFSSLASAVCILAGPCMRLGWGGTWPAGRLGPFSLRALCQCHCTGSGQVGLAPLALARGWGGSGLTDSGSGCRWSVPPRLGGHRQHWVMQLGSCSKHGPPASGFGGRLVPLGRRYEWGVATQAGLPTQLSYY